jgi:hypothetical protein
MSDNDEKLLNKLENIESHLSSIDVTLAKQEVSLSEHVRRSETLEDLVSYIRDEEIEPIKAHVARVQGAMKTVSVLLAAVASIAAVLKFFGKL